MVSLEFRARMAALDIFPIGGPRSQKDRERAYQIILEVLQKQKADDCKRALEWFNSYEDDEAIRKMAAEDFEIYLEKEQ